MNPVQKYPHITELFACTRKMLAFMFLFPTNSLISLETCSTPRLSKKIISFFLQNKATKCVPIHQGLLRMVHPLFFLGRLFLE